MIDATDKAIKHLARKAAAAVHAAPPIVLTKDESTLLGYYRTMDVRGRGETMAKAQCNAENYPFSGIKKNIVAPVGIRLVAAFGKAVLV